LQSCHILVLEYCCFYTHEFMFTLNAKLKMHNKYTICTKYAFTDTSILVADFGLLHFSAHSLILKPESLVDCTDKNVISTPVYICNTWLPSCIHGQYE
jgi:hypothetical protein